MSAVPEVAIPPGNGHASKAQVTRPPPVTVPVAPVAPVAPVMPDIAGRIRKQLLAMARRYETEGQVRGAMDLYWQLATEEGETAEGVASVDALLALAARYEREGSVRMARAMYERLAAELED